MNLKSSAGRSGRYAVSDANGRSVWKADISELVVPRPFQRLGNLAAVSKESPRDGSNPDAQRRGQVTSFSLSEVSCSKRPGPSREDLPA